MSDTVATVLVVDDDVSVREALEGLIRSVGLNVVSFASVAEFLAAKRPDAPGCVVLDVRLPGQSGLDLQAELPKAGVHLPVIFITGHGDIPMTVRAMKAGAVEFLVKPFRDQDLLDAIGIAVERDRQRRGREKIAGEMRGKFAALTAREREVMGLVASGLLNKQIAAELGVSEITVKVHRGAVMRKLGARTVADLVRIAERLGSQGA